MAESNNLVLKKISDITDFKFFIPSFQRGYRWDIMQVEDLLNDIKEYIDIENKESFLCLQPVVVYEKKNKDDKQNENQNEKDKTFVVIDGQQRLTAIAIIKYYLYKHDKQLKQFDYNIEYEKYIKEKGEKTLSDILSKIKGKDIENEQDFKKLCLDNKLDNKKIITLTNKFATEKCSLDKYHIILSYLVIAYYFNKNSEYKDKFIELFKPSNDKHSIQFIWYNVTDEITQIEQKDGKEETKINETKAIDIFTRLNIGKIPLTDAELIKALFLKKDNFKESEIDKKLHIAYKWDEIEKTLNNDTFWYFISNKNEDEMEKRNRIELILELAIDTQNGKNHELFKEYENRLKENNKLDELWQEIEECFMTLKEWYNDNEMYHYVGYYLCFEEDIYTIYDTIKNLNYIMKKSKLIKKIKEKILFKEEHSELDKTEYKHDYIIDYYKYNQSDNYFLNLDFNEHKYKSAFHRILLFIDVYNYIQLNKSNSGYGKLNSFFINRYPFDIFKYEKKQSWSLEHIASQKNYDIKDRLDHIKKITSELKNINIMIHEQFKKEINICINNDIDSDKNIPIEDDKWEEILSIIDSLNNGDINNTNESTDLETYKHTICNIALLQKDLNSQLNNNPFMIKRKIILDIRNRFIPDNTINAFSKKFNQNADTLIYWKKSDMLAYGCYILNTLKEFYNKENSNTKKDSGNKENNNNQGE